MKMKTYFSIFLLASFAAYGQQSTIGLQSTKALGMQDAIEAEKVSQKIKEALLGSGSYEVLDREALGYILNEQEIQKQISSINAEVVEQGRVKGAAFVIASKLFDVTYKKIGFKLSDVLDNDSKKKGVQRAIFSFSVDILDTETGATVNSQKFSIGTISDNVGGITKEEAFRAALNAKSLDKKLGQFLDKSGGSAIKLISIEESEDGRAKLVLINVGSDSNVKKNKKFSVYEITTLNIDGEDVMREKWIADLKITAVEGTKLSTAKVDKGGDTLKQLFESGGKLICKSK